MSGHSITHAITSTANKVASGTKDLANKVATGTKTAVNTVKHETVKDANIIAHGTTDAVHKTATWFVNAEHTVARTSLKTVGQVTAWTSKAGKTVQNEVIKDAGITVRGFGAAICETAKHGDAIDMVWNDVALPITREVMTVSGPETEAFIPALEIANIAASEGFKAAGGWPALEKQGCRLAHVRTMIILL